MNVKYVRTYLPPDINFGLQNKIFYDIYNTDNFYIYLLI